MWMAMEKQAITMITQIALRDLVLDVEICTRPWIVELSRNSRIIPEAILLAQIFSKYYAIILREPSFLNTICWANWCPPTEPG